MTLDEAKMETTWIWRARDDYEAAHGMEDKLRLKFIQFVAETGPEDLAEIAQVILATEDFDFPRYCA